MEKSRNSEAVKLLETLHWTSSNTETQRGRTINTRQDRIRLENKDVLVLLVPLISCHLSAVKWRQNISTNQKSNTVRHERKTKTKQNKTDSKQEGIPRQQRQYSIQQDNRGETGTRRESRKRIGQKKTRKGTNGDRKRQIRVKVNRTKRDRRFTACSCKHKSYFSWL